MDHQPTAPSIAVILVVDQVGSTHFLVTHGEAVATRFAGELSDTVGSIVAALDGTVVTSTGDGFIARFGLGSAALDAAVEIQRAVQSLSTSYPESVQVRIGLAIGEVHHDGVDLRGWPLFLATRLCDAANDGTILASQVLVDVVATRSNHELGPAQTFDLKGLSEPAAAVEVAWQLSGDPTEIVLNPELAMLDQRPWVGRAQPIATLLDAALPPDPHRLVVVAGEPGAGKSRLIARFASEAGREGHLVMYGASPRESRSGYSPIVSALRAALGSLSPEVRSSALAGTAGRELSRLLPEIGGPGREILHPSDGPGANRLLLEALAEVLGRLGEAANGLTLVMDDLQWADDVALGTIRYLAGPSGSRRVCVVAVIRSGEVDRLTDFIADTARHGEVLRIDLDGLGPADIAQLITETQPSLDPSEVSQAADHLAARTGGNALFVTSLMQHHDWVESDVAARDGHLPSDELSFAIAERLAGLDPDDIRILTTASVIGQRFPTRLLVDMAGVGPDRMVACIGRARQAGLLHDLGGGEVAFVHDLVRVALMPPDDTFERAAVHRAIAEQLDQEPDPDVIVTANHFLAALAAGADRSTTLDWTERAARLSMRQLAYASAARYYRDAIGLIGSGDTRRHALTFELGRAQLHGGDPAYRETLLNTVDDCLAAGLPDLAADAALANNRGFYSAAGAADNERIGALERVLETEQEPAVRSQLTATLAVESLFTDARPDDLATMSLEAVELARRSGDPAALTGALTLRQDANYRITNLDERLHETEELLELTAVAEPPARFWAVAHRARTVGEAGRWDEVAQMVDEAASVASASRSPILEWYAAVLRGALAIQLGELREAQAVIDQGYQLGLETGQPDALIPTSGQQCEVLRRRGRYETIHQLAAQNLDADLLRRSVPMRAVLFLEQGLEDEALSLWQSVGLAGAVDVPVAQLGHNLLHARRLCRAFGDESAERTIEARLQGAPPYLFCNYWEPTQADA